MSVGFDTQNLFLIDEEEGTLVFYDAVHFEATTLPLRSLGLLLHKETFDAVSGFALARVKKLAEDPPEGFDLQAAGLAALKMTHPLLPLTSIEWPGVGTPLAGAEDFIPGYDMKMWVIVSDTPRESFHPEDYEAKPLEPFDMEENILPIDFAVEIDSLEGAIRHFPVGAEVNFDEVLAESGAEMLDESARQAWALISLPKGSNVTGALSPESPLPVLREFIGPQGVGVAGKMVNLTIDMTPAQEFQCAIPFACAQEVFITLYAHLSRRGAIPPSPPWLIVEDVSRTERMLKAKGFKLHGSTDDSSAALKHGDPAASIWNRGKDWVHIYINPPGLEALGRDPLPSYLFAATANGSRDVEARAQLIRDIFAK